MCSQPFSASEKAIAGCRTDSLRWRRPRCPNRVSSPMLAPLLMPETTRSGRTSIRPVSATWTQSDGVPLTAMKPFEAVRTDRGRLSVRGIRRALWFGRDDGQPPSPCSALTSASSPGPNNHHRSKPEFALCIRKKVKHGWTEPIVPSEADPGLPYPCDNPQPDPAPVAVESAATTTTPAQTGRNHGFLIHGATGPSLRSPPPSSCWPT